LFNLIDDPWIPVFFHGKTMKVSLKQLFEDAETISGFVGTTIEKIALTRLVLCITQSAVKIETEEDWQACRDSIVTEALAYLQRWHDSFNLFGEKAFLQVPWIQATPAKKRRYLSVKLANGHNHTLFDHTSRGPSSSLRNDEVALALLCMQCFALQHTLRAKSYVCLGSSIPYVHAAKPSLSVKKLLTIVLGPCILDTIHANLIPQEWLTAAGMRVGRPLWEYGQFNLADQKVMDAIGSGYLSNLIPFSRGIVLSETGDDVVFVDGVRTNKDYRDPMFSCKYVFVPPRTEGGSKAKARKTKAGPTKKGTLPFLRVSHERAGWRDLESILRIPGGSAGAPSLDEGAWALKHFVGGDAEFTIYTGGVVTNPKGTKLEAAPEWVYELPPGFNKNRILARITDFVRETERTHGVLQKAIGQCLTLDNIEKRRKGENTKKTPIRDGLRSQVGTLYWPVVESFMIQYLEELSNGQDSPDWQKRVHEVAQTIYTKVLPSVTLKAEVAGELLLRREL